MKWEARHVVLERNDKTKRLVHSRVPFNKDDTQQVWLHDELSEDQESFDMRDGFTVEPSNMVVYLGSPNQATVIKLCNSKNNAMCLIAHDDPTYIEEFKRHLVDC